MKIFKYQLILLGEFILDLPKEAEILKVANGSMWVMLDTRKEAEQRKFVSYGTGHEIIAPIPPSILKYIGTWFEGALPYVWHLFEIKEKK